MSSKTTKKPDDSTKTFEEGMKLFQLFFSELESSKSMSEAQRTARLEKALGLFSYLLYLKLEDLIEAENWYVGILLSSSILEDMGKRRLKLIFKERMDSNKIDRLKLEEIIMLLLASGAIDFKMYQKLMEVKEARNRLAHDPFKAMSLFLQTGLSNNKESQHARSIIKKAALCLRAIIPPRTKKTGTMEGHSMSK
jgi:hypothetical protein